MAVYLSNLPGLLSPEKAKDSGYSEFSQSAERNFSTVSDTMQMGLGNTRSAEGSLWREHPNYALGELLSVQRSLFFCRGIILSSLLQPKLHSFPPCYGKFGGGSYFK